MKRTYVIGSRGSKLALWQAEWVKSQLESLHGEVTVRIEVIKTTGDIRRDAPLAVIGGKGVFTKEIEEALLERRVDIAVHSLKDLPTRLHADLALTAVVEREDTRDALVLPERTAGDQASIANLKWGAVVGTSSLRRRAQLKSLRPDLEIAELRGNVDTRLRKLDEGGYDAIVLASAGLRRLGLAHRINSAIPVEEIMPAVGQGALGVETRADDPGAIELVRFLDHSSTRTACVAERAFLRELGGGCQLPIAAHATCSGNLLRIEGLVASVSGDRVIRDAAEGLCEGAEELGGRLASRLIERGATSLLADLTA